MQIVEGIPAAQLAAMRCCPTLYMTTATTAQPTRLRFAFTIFSVLTTSIIILIAPVVAADTDQKSNVTYVSGTCKKTTPEFNMSSYYNQESMLVSTFGNQDISGSNWDLGRDGAFVGYNVVYCATSSPGEDLLSLIRLKGFTITSTCNLAGVLAYPKFHVFMLFDYIDGVILTAADNDAIREFYIRGGGLYIFTDNCPWFHNANPMYRNFPYPLNLFQMRYNNGIPYFPLRNGNPVGDNQFGHHPAFTGIPEMSSGTTLSIPFFDNKFGLGVFAPMCTTVIDRVPSACSGEPPSSYIYSHASVMYVDPPVQLVNFTQACNWGRIVHDTAFTRYYVEPKRTGCQRLAANVVVWLTNIERIQERLASGTPLNSTDTSQCFATVNSSSAGDNDVNKTQVLGCSNGDAITLKSPTLMCRVGFAGGADAPACLALVVTAESGTTCVVDIQNAKIGTYWIMVDGKNSSLQFSVTAASLTPRGTISAVTGTCVKLSDTAASGCSDGSSITIDWTLPYPSALTLGLGSTASVCATFSVSGTHVYCRFQGLNNLAKGRYQTYINGVATGIPLTILTDKASLNKVLCSGSHTISPQSSSEVTKTVTVLMTHTPTSTISASGRSRSLTQTKSLTGTTTVTVVASKSHSVHVSGSVTLTGTLQWTVTPPQTKSTTDQWSSTVALQRTWSLTRTKTLSKSYLRTITLSGNEMSTTAALSSSKERMTITRTLKPSASESWGCVDGQRLIEVLHPLLSSAASVVAIQNSDVVNGTTISLRLPPPVNDTAVLLLRSTAALHIPWYDRWEARAVIRPLQCPNQEGFADPTNRNIPMVIVFPFGLLASTSSNMVEATLIIPPISSYHIYIQETVSVDVAVSDLTLGSLCNFSSSTAGAYTPIVRLEVSININQLLASAQESVTPIVAVMTAAVPFAAPDVQVLVALALMPCSNSYQKRTFAMFRALSVFTLDDSYEGVLWGNLIANVAGLGLHMALIGVVSVVTKRSLGDAMTAARFPSLYLQLLWQLTFASNVFAAIQIIAGDNDGNSDLTALGAGVLMVFGVAIPAGLYLYVALQAEAAYYIFEYHKWRRSETNLRVRLLSRFLMPLGHWEPQALRRHLGPLLTLQSRPERIWVLLPLVSPTIIGLFSLVRNESSANCVYVYLAMALLHLLLVAVMIFFRPLRSMIEDWFGAAGYIVTTLYLLFAAVNLAYPSAREVESVMAVIVVAQIALLFVRLVYHISHIFIARRLWDVVPHVLLFEWHKGSTRVEEDIDVDACRTMSKDGVAPRHSSALYNELSDLMTKEDDSEVELHSPLLLRDGKEDEHVAAMSELWLQKHHQSARDNSEDNNNDNDHDVGNLLLLGRSSTLAGGSATPNINTSSSQPPAGGSKRLSGGRHSKHVAAGDDLMSNDEFSDLLGTIS